MGEGGRALSKLSAAIGEYQAEDARERDRRGLRAAIDSLEATFCSDTRRAQAAGAHRADGHATVVNWLSRLCGMSATSAADRPCVGSELESLPQIASALRTGALTHQSTPLLCHTREPLGAN